MEGNEIKSAKTGLQPSSAFEITEYDVYQANAQGFWKSESNLISSTLSDSQSSGPVSFFGRWQGGNPRIDWIFVSRYVSPEPSHGIWGSEEQCRKLSIRLSGGFDYSAKENIKIRLGAVVKDVNASELVSDANVTLRIYYPNSTLWISGKMFERQLEKGFYDWESSKTIYQMKLPDGVYSVYVNASINNGPVTSDFLLFHIDPPFEETASLTPLLYYATAIILLIAGTTTGIALLRRHKRHQVAR